MDASPQRSCSAARVFRERWYFLGNGVTSGLFSVRPFVCLSAAHGLLPSRPGPLPKAAERWLIMTAGRWLPIASVLHSPHLSQALQSISLDNYSDWVQMMQGGVFFSPCRAQRERGNFTGGTGTTGDIEETVAIKQITSFDMIYVNCRFMLHYKVILKITLMHEWTILETQELCPRKWGQMMLPCLH